MAELKDELKEIGFGVVKADFRGEKLSFKALDGEESLLFLSLFMQGNTNEFFTKHREDLTRFVSHSLSKPLAWVVERIKSPGFAMFCINRMLEALDYDFFILNSLELQDKLMALIKQLPKEKQVEAEKKIAEIEKTQTAGSEESSQQSASPQGAVSGASLKEAPLKKSSSSTRKYRRRKRRK